MRVLSNLGRLYFYDLVSLPLVTKGLHFWKVQRIKQSTQSKFYESRVARPFVR